MSSIFIKRKQYRQLLNRVAKCEMDIQSLREECFKMVKRILREPDELSEELNTKEALEEYIDKIINH